MRKISEEYLEAHNTELVKCPKCNSEDVISNLDKGYFWIEKCNQCGYIRKNSEPNPE